jgi:UreF.
MNPISELQSPDELQHGLGPIWAAARAANPEFSLSGPVTFPTGMAFAAACETWNTGLFQPMLLPAFLSALEHARRGEAREILDLDARLSSTLPGDARTGSIRAGRRLSAASRELKGDRTLQRLAAWTADGTMDGHLVTIFAARCAAFSLFDRAAVGAYLFQELCGGAPDAPAPVVCDFIRLCLEPQVSRELRAA